MYKHTVCINSIIKKFVSRIKYYLMNLCSETLAQTAWKKCNFVAPNRFLKTFSCRNSVLINAVSINIIPPPIYSIPRAYQSHGINCIQEKKKKQRSSIEPHKFQERNGKNCCDVSGQKCAAPESRSVGGHT